MGETTSKGNELARGERLQIMLDREELAAVDEFRFSNRFPSRAAAVRELLRRGLVAGGYTVARGSRSSSFGVIASGPVSQEESGGQA